MLRLLTIAACALALGGGFAAAASSPQADKAAALQRLGSVATTDSNAEPVAPPDSVTRPIPGRMLGHDAPVPIAPSLLHVQNGWLASDGKTLVAVYAGSAGSDPSVGRLVIVRQNLASGGQTVSTVDAGATGALAVASAGTGRLRIRTAGRRLLRLDLGTATLTRSSRTAATVARPERPRSSDQVSHPYGR